MNVTPENLFRALSDTTRLRCLALLRAEGELCVCELTHALDVAQPKVSRHLAQLRDVGLVTDRRSGQWVYYRLSAAPPAWIQQVLGITLAAAADRPPYDGDRKRLETMGERPGLSDGL